MNVRTRLATTAAGILASAGMAVAMAAPANAAPAPTAHVVSSTELHAATATVIGPVVDGQAAVSLSDGQTISVRAASLKYLKIQPKGAVAPHNVVSGNCGSAYVYENGVGNRAVTLETGFSLAAGTYAIDFSWRVQLDDRGGTSYQSWGDPLNLAQHWDGSRVVSGLSVGGARATINPGNSYAITATGGVCTAGPAFDTTTIY